jgi:hypothetical protein
MTVLEFLTPTVGWSQAPDTLQQVDQRLAEKRAAAEAHRKQMESIKDPTQLTAAMQQHFQMTEDILALMLERRKLQQAQATTNGTPAGQGSMPGGGMQRGGMPGGGMMEHGMGMMQKEMGGMQGGGMPGGGMMQKEMGGMQGSGMPGGGAQGSGTQGGSPPANPSAHSGMSGMPSSGTQSASATTGGDMTQLMQRITEHSAYMETLQDKAVLAQEMLRHQKMLDQMLQLMQ